MSPQPFRVGSPDLHAQFAAMLPDVRLPLRLDGLRAGVVLDADGRQVLVVDHYAERSNADATAIATAVMLAVNTCGGFRAEVRS